MASFEQYQVIGNLGSAPDFSYSDNGTAYCRFSVAVNERWTDKSGETQEKTKWVSVVCFRRTAEIANEILEKGASVFLQGKVEARAYVTDDGEARASLDMTAFNIQRLDRRTDRESREEPL